LPRFGVERWRWVGGYLVAVGAEVAELARLVPVDPPAGAVDHPVVEAALGPQVPGHGGPARRAVDQVMDLEPVALLTAREGTAAVTHQDRATEGRGDHRGG